MLVICSVVVCIVCSANPVGFRQGGVPSGVSTQLFLSDSGSQLNDHHILKNLNAATPTKTTRVTHTPKVSVTSGSADNPYWGIMLVAQFMSANKSEIADIRFNITITIPVITNIPNTTKKVATKTTSKITVKQSVKVVNVTPAVNVTRTLIISP